MFVRVGWGGWDGAVIDRVDEEEVGGLPAEGGREGGSGV